MPFTQGSFWASFVLSKGERPCGVLQLAGKAEDDSERYARLPQRLRTKMMAFQRQGVQFALAHGGRVLVGDEMGALPMH